MAWNINWTQQTILKARYGKIKRVALILNNTQAFLKFLSFFLSDSISLFIFSHPFVESQTDVY